MEDSWKISEKTQADIFANHLFNTFQLHYNILSPMKINEVKTYLNSSLLMCFPREVSLLVRLNLILKISSPENKILGFVLITFEVIEHLSKETTISLIHIYNAMIHLSYFLIFQKYFIITVIIKAQKPPNFSSSYRPISLFSTISKMFEKLVLKCLLLVFNDNNILFKFQFGFHNNHFVVHQVLWLVDKNSFALKKKNYIVPVLSSKSLKPSIESGTQIRYSN